MKGILFSFAVVVVLLTSAGANEFACGWGSSAFTAAPGPDSPEYRKYAPDRQVDIKHLALDVTPDFTNRAVAGSATWTFSPIAQPLAQLRLDGVDLNILSVTGSQAVADFHVASEKIVITFTRPIPVGQETTITLRYSAHPEQGLYFRTPELGFAPEDMHIWTQGEPDEARHWFPCYDYPNEKFTSEVTCHVPSGMVVLSNGRKISEKADEHGLSAVHWSQDKPMVNYLIALVAGRLKSIEDRHRDVPLHFWTPASEIAYASNSFVDTKPAMAFFESEIGVPYPWDKYDQVCIQDYHWGGMENTSLTTLNINTLFPSVYGTLRNSQGLVAHELAHQWFGDLLTCKDWSHIWLNEGFASFYDLLYSEHKEGPNEFYYRLYEGLKTLTSQTNQTKSIVWRKYDKPTEQFDSFAYGKGSFVLNMIRQQLDGPPKASGSARGASLFRRCIQTYVERHKFGSVVTDDLRAVLEELSGRSFDRFFDQWVYHGGFPILEVDYSWDAQAKQAKISVRQTQPVSDNVALFQFRLPVQFHTKAGVTNHTLLVTQKSEDFSINLPAQPQLVRVDPTLSVLAKINFKPSSAMLQMMVTNQNDVVGRFIACEQLAEKKDADSVDRLKQTLNMDSYWGVRVAASKALRAIHTDEAFAALLASDSPGETKAQDVRVRKQIVNDIMGFFRPEAFDRAFRVLGAETNPDIAAVALKSLDAAPATNARPVLLRYLNSDSWRQQLMETALQAIRATDDRGYIEPVRSNLIARAGSGAIRALAKADGNRAELPFDSAFLPTRTMTIGLDCLAYLSREEANKDAVRELIAAFTNHPRDSVRLAAINALGTLRDERALPVLERFAGAQKEKPETTAAARAIEAIRTNRKTAAEIGELRKDLLDLQKQNRELKKEFESLKAKVEANKKSGK